MKRGVQDYSFVASFDKKDLQAIKIMIGRIQAGINYDIKHNLEHDSRISDYYLQQCQRRYDDHPAPLEIGNQKVEFVQVAKSDPRDLVTTAGCNYLIDYFRGAQTTPFRYVGKGGSSTAAALTDTALGSEISTRQTCANNAIFSGWGEWVGMSMRFAALFGEQHAGGNYTVYESGVFTASSGGTMLSRDVYGENPVLHTYNFGVVLICIIVDLCPRASPVV